MFDVFFDPAVLAEAWPAVRTGIGVTLALALLTIGLGTLAGFLLALLRALESGKRRPLTAAIVAFSDVFRAVPPLVLLVVLSFALPSVGLRLSGLFAAGIALVLVLAASAEEIFWAGITSIPRAQWDAGFSSGLSRLAVLRHIVLPQAVRLTVPPLTNRAIATGKNTALASVVAVPEVLSQASSVQAQLASPAPLMLAALLYLALFLPLVRLGRRLEARMERA